MRKTATPEDFDLDFDDEHDAPRGREPRRLFGANPAARFGSAGLAALLLAIVVNAVFLQDQRHAAPLFQLSLRTAAPTDEPVVPPLPAPRPVELAPARQAARNDIAPRIEVGRNDPIGRAIAQMDQPARSDKPRNIEIRATETKPVEKLAEAKPVTDSIGGLIRNVGAAPTQQAEPDIGVMAAQRALMKLGFVIKPDGYMGGTTRQAIERFERDNRMPVRGELTARVKAELARQSGVEIR